MPLKKSYRSLQPIIFLILSIFITSCERQQSSGNNSFFDSLMSSNDLNKTIQISNLDFMTNGLDPGFYSIGLQNNSDMDVVFPVDYGLKIFMSNGNKDDWEEIDYEGNYHPSAEGKNPTLSPKGSDQDRIAFMIYPIIPAAKQNVKIRVFVVGTAESLLSTNKKIVAAFTDILINK